MTQLDPSVNKTNPGDLLAIDDAADEYSVSRSTLYRLVRRGQLVKYKRPGDKRTFVSRAQLSDVLEFRPSD